MEEEKAEHINLSLGPELLKHIDDYYFAAQLPNRSETIVYLTQMALDGEFPSDHLAVLAKIERSRQEPLPAAILERQAKKYNFERTRVYVGFTASQLAELDRYKTAVGYPRRNETIKYLIGLSLEGRFQRFHLETLQRMGRSVSIGAGPEVPLGTQALG